MADSTWETDALPILEVVAEAERRGADIGAMNAAAVAAVPHLSSITYRTTIRHLHHGGYLDAAMQTASQSVAPVAVMIRRMIPPGLRAIGQWSGDPVAGLLAALDRTVAAEPDDAKRSALRRF